MRLSIATWILVGTLSSVSAAEVQVSVSVGETPDIAWDGNKFGIVFDRVGVGLVFRTLDPLAATPGPELVIINHAVADPVLIWGNGFWVSAYPSGSIKLVAFDDLGNKAFPELSLSTAVSG